MKPLDYLRKLAKRWLKALRAQDSDAVARWGRREMIALLLSRGADPNAAGAPWAKPLTWARRKGHDDVAADPRRADASE